MIYALYHSEHETLGLIAPVLKEVGLPFRELHLYAGDGLPRSTGDLEGLIVMGGPMNVDDVTNFPFLLPEVQLIEKVLTDRKPILGICLGAQLIAKALGSRVYPNKHREVGWHPIKMMPKADSDLVFHHAPETMDVLHWHGDTFDLPMGGIHLARSGRCENQAFRWDHSYGLQFHLEATPQMIRRWAQAPEDIDYIRGAGEDPAAILRDTTQQFENLQPVARQLFSEYLTQSFASNPLLAHR